MQPLDDRDVCPWVEEELVEVSEGIFLTKEEDQGNRDYDEMKDNEEVF